MAKGLVRYKELQTEIMVPQYEEVEKMCIGVLSEGLVRMRKIISNGEDDQSIKATNAVTNISKFIASRIDKTAVTDDDLEHDDDYGMGE